MAGLPNRRRGMMNKKLAILAAGFLLANLAPSAAPAAENKLGGYMFGDYYYNLSGPREKENGFWWRRIYLTDDLKWTDKFSGRFRLEANDVNVGQTTRQPKDKLNPYVKESSLTYKCGNWTVSAGLTPTPTWALPEKVWGYRPIEKTTLDLNKAGNPVDMGVQVMRKLGDKADLAVMVGNGNGFRSEADDNKKVYVQGHYQPGSLESRVYVDWQKQPKGMDELTLAALVGVVKEGMQGGAEFYQRTVKKSLAGADVKSFGVSLYATKKLSGHKKVFARADLYEPNSDADKDRETLLIGGLDLKLAEQVHVMPNVRAVLYQDSGKDAEITPRITGFFEF